jgi:hypothetical protein
LKSRKRSLHRIEVFVDRIEQLFNSMDPSPFHERDLDDDAEEFIVGWAREFPHRDPISLVVHVNQLAPQGEPSGQSSRPRLRAPYGARHAWVLKIAASLGYRSIYWTLDSQDRVEPVKTPQFLIDRITSKSDAELDGAIILMHVGVRSTADALPAIIANLQERGFHLVTISTLLQ